MVLIPSALKALRNGNDRARAGVIAGFGCNQTLSTASSERFRVFAAPLGEVVTAQAVLDGGTLSISLEGGTLSISSRIVEFDPAYCLGKDLSAIRLDKQCR